MICEPDIMHMDPRIALACLGEAAISNRERQELRPILAAEARWLDLLDEARAAAALWNTKLEFADRRPQAALEKMAVVVAGLSRLDSSRLAELCTDAHKLDGGVSAGQMFASLYAYYMQHKPKAHRAGYVISFP